MPLRIALPDYYDSPAPVLVPTPEQLEQLKARLLERLQAIQHLPVSALLRYLLITREFGHRFGVTGAHIRQLLRELEEAGDIKVGQRFDPAPEEPEPT